MPSTNMRLLLAPCLLLPFTTAVEVLKNTYKSTRPPTPKTPTIESESKYPWSDLDRYVWKADDTYSWSLLPNYPETHVDEDGDGEFLHYVLNVTTQQWQDQDMFGPDENGDVWDCSIWYHQVGITVPMTYLDDLKAGKVNLMENRGFVLIGSGKYYDGPPGWTSEQVRYQRKIALATNSIGVNIRNVPHQPCTFAADPRQVKRTEDAVIAWTWRKFIDNPTIPEFLLRSPMTKSVVKVMDAVQEFMWETHEANIAHFCVTGASKRGWATWTVGAVDYERVNCIMPVQMDVLNIVDSLHGHYRSLGNWTIQFANYYAENILNDIDTDGVVKMAAVIDPYTYRERFGNALVYYTNSGNDEFFLPDDSWYYFQDIVNKPVSNYLNIVPNAWHNWKVVQDELWTGETSLYYAHNTGQPLPSVYWKRWGGETSGKIEFRSKTEISRSSVWIARSVPNRRDFRKSGANWDCWMGNHRPLVPEEPDCIEFPEYLETNITRYTEYLENPAHGVMDRGFDVEEEYFYVNYVFELPESDDGNLYYYAYFLDVEIKGPEGLKESSVQKNVFKFASETGITPESHPFEDCGIDNECRQFMT